MSTVKSYTLTGTAAAAAAYVAAANTVAGTPMTLLAAATAAALAATPREIQFTTSADMSAVTLTIVGLDRGGQVITEDLVLPASATTKLSRKVYSRITSITPNVTDGANTVSAGNPQRIVTPWVIIPFHTNGRDVVPSALVATEIVSGAPDGSVEVTMDPFWNISGEGAYVQSSTDTTPPAVTSAQGVGVRFVVTSASGTIKARFVRPRI